MSSNKSPVHQLKVTLKGSSPPIWRRILVPGDISLAKLHRILQITMGWWNCHLHVFEIHGREYGQPDRNLELEFENEQRVKLGEIVSEKDRFVYQYDFGDDWRHQIVVEKIVPREEGKRYPACVAGARACPPEDCGGIWGYANFLATIKDPKHKEHESMLEWIGGSFDSEAFNLEQVNQQLRGLK